MPSTLYSTTCYIKNDLYRLSIDVDDNDENSTDAQSTTGSSDFSSPDILIDTIKPSLTRINFQLIKDKKNTNIPKTIILNYLLNVQQPNGISNKTKRNFNSNEAIATNDTTTPALERSQKTSYTTLNTGISDSSVPETPAIRRQFSFKRLFSSQTYADSAVNFSFKTLIKISYIDVSNSIRWNIKKLEIEVETEDIANELYTNLNLCLSTLTQRPHRLLVFVNPIGGKGRAPLVYDKKILPLFEEANITLKTIYTERANHAQDYIINEDINDYDGLICVGGDGMFAELCHGLLLRTSYESEMNINDPQVNINRPNLRIGIIPAGSTDAVVFGTTGLNDPITSALQIIVGETLSIDIATVHNEKGFVRFMATMLAYGFFGDIIQQSDKWRFLGPLRYDLAGFCQFIRNKSYHSKLTITLSPYDSSLINRPESISSMNNCIDGKRSSTGSDSQQSSNKKTSESFNVIHKLIRPGLIFCSRNCETCALEHNHDSNQLELPLQIEREGRYTTVNCLNMPGRCAKSKFGMSPFVHLGDGTFDLLLVQRSWRTGFLRFLWQVANDGRSIQDLPNVERYRVSEVLIHPLHTEPKRLGNWACDGELISGNEIQIRIHRQVLNLFASGIQFDKLQEYNPIKKTKKTECHSRRQYKEKKEREENN